MSAIYICQITCDRCGKVLRQRMPAYAFAHLRTPEVFSVEYYRKQLKKAGWLYVIEADQHGLHNRDLCSDCHRDWRLFPAELEVE